MDGIQFLNQVSVSEVKTTLPPPAVIAENSSRLFCSDGMGLVSILKPVVPVPASSLRAYHSCTSIHKTPSGVHSQSPASPSRKPSLTSSPSRIGFFFEASVTRTLL